MGNLKVCEKCGWYEHLGLDECDPVRGVVADKLAKAISVPSTKLGFGFGKLTFIFSDRLHLTLDVHRDGTFDVDSLWMLDPLDTVQVIDLVSAIGQIGGR